MHVASLEVDYDSFYSTVTRDVDATIDLWCLNRCDMLSLQGGDIDEVVEHMDDHVGIRNSARKGTEARILVTEECLMDQEECPFERVVTHHDCISLPPHTYSGGTISARVAAREEHQLSDIYNDLVESFHVSVAGKREVSNVHPEVPLLVTGSSLPDLSARQREAVTVACEHGYYDIPRKCTTEDVAARLGVSRRTAQEHLRRAEQKLLAWFVDLL